MSQVNKVALFAVTQRGVEQARQLRIRLRIGELFRPARFGAPAHPWEHVAAAQLAAQVAECFQQYDQLVFFLAAGAVTRLIAPWLASKERDPGVLCVDEAGRFVIPFLSGHEGGANAFARTVAGHLGATPVITTASDAIGGFSLDVLQEVCGWTPEPRNMLKTAAAALVNQQPLAILQEIWSPGCRLADWELPAHVTCLRSSEERDAKALAVTLWITDRLVPEIEAERILWYRPKSLVLGVGCERGVPPSALEDGLDRFLREKGFAKASIGVLASVDVKADEQALRALATKYQWATVFYAPEELAVVPNVPNPSEVVAKCVGTPGVAEPAALLAAQSETLLVAKQIVQSPLASQRMTFALARSAQFRAANHEQGKVTFIGAGPGDPDLLTLKAQRELAQADTVIYAGSLIPEAVLRHASATAQVRNSATLTLEEVMEALVSDARSGQRVVRLHSGDTSLYSAMQEQMTLLDEAGIEYDVIPGVSSFQAAAAALAAELTLPEKTQTIILTRAEGETKMPSGESLASLAAHRASLCLFLSVRLAEQVQEQLLTAYPPDTPVAIAYRVSWPDERIVVTELCKLSQTIREEKLSRTTLIIVGEAVARRGARSRLYDPSHGHIFRSRRRDETHPAS